MTTLSPRIHGLTFEAVKKRKSKGASASKRSTLVEDEMKGFSNPTSFFSTNLHGIDRPPSDSEESSIIEQLDYVEEEETYMINNVSSSTTKKSNFSRLPDALERTLQSPYEKGMGTGLDSPDIIDISKDSRKRLSFTPALDDSPKRLRISDTAQTLRSTDKNSSTFVITPNKTQTKEKLLENNNNIVEQSDDTIDVTGNWTQDNSLLKTSMITRSSSRKILSKNDVESITNSETDNIHQGLKNITTPVVNNNLDNVDPVDFVSNSVDNPTEDVGNNVEISKKKRKTVKTYSSMQIQAGESRLFRERKTRERKKNESIKHNSLDTNSMKLTTLTPSKVAATTQDKSDKISSDIVNQSASKHKSGMSMAKTKNNMSRHSTFSNESNVQEKLVKKSASTNRKKSISSESGTSQQEANKSLTLNTTRRTRSSAPSYENISLAAFVYDLEVSKINSDVTYIEPTSEIRHVNKPDPILNNRKVHSKTLPASMANKSKLSSSKNNNTTVTGSRNRKKRHRIVMPSKQNPKTVSNTTIDHAGKSILKDNGSVPRKDNLHVTIVAPNETQMIPSPKKSAPTPKKSTKRESANKSKRLSKLPSGKSELPSAKKRTSPSPRRRASLNECDYALDQVEIEQQDIEGFVPYEHSWCGFGGPDTSPSKRGTSKKVKNKPPVPKNNRKGNRSFKRYFQDSRSCIDNENMNASKDIIMCAVKNVESNTIEKLPLICPATSVRWSAPARNPGRDVFLHKYFSFPSFSFGQLKIDPYGKKGLQKTKHDHLLFYVLSGSVKLTLHETEQHCVSGMAFIVPEGNLYDIENLEDYEARILFYQMKHGTVS